MNIDELEEIEDLVYWNLSFGIPIIETLTEINHLELLTFFS
jgi:hypothetical protein